MSNFWERVYHPNGITGYNPFIINNMSSSVNRLIAAVNYREKIVIYGGCDVDTICGISALMLLLKYLNADVEYFIDGEYGKHNVIDEEAIKGSIDFLGAQLLISVGVNFKSEKESMICKELNIDSIVLENTRTYYKGDMFYINPNDESCSYRYKDLSISGLVFKLMQAISIYYNMSSINRYLDLIMIGTVYKECSFDGENYVFLKEGMNHLELTDNYGLKAIMNSYDITEVNVNTIWDIVKILTPVSRVVSARDNAKIIVELLTTDDEDRAKQIVKYLKKNRKIENIIAGNSLG